MKLFTKKLSDSPNNFFIILIHLAFYYGAHSLPVKILKLNLLLSFVKIITCLFQTTLYSIFYPISLGEHWLLGNLLVS